MKKIISVSAALAATILMNASVASAWQYELVNPDHDSTIELYFNPDAGGNAIKDFTFNFGYDGHLEIGDPIWVNMTLPPDLGDGDTLADTLSFVSKTFDAPTELVQINDTTDWPIYDLLNNFSASTGPEPGVLVSERTLFGTFTYSGDAVDDSYEDMWFHRYSTSFSSTVDGYNYKTLEYAEHFKDMGTNASAVPIPGTVLLLGSGLLGIVGIRRKPSA